ncbi:hypothetical protein N7451_006779 [Penicillium sp. IBT 35674x]|nr:hypothetical protein N7451_006779 [Penicillium sp. IBT 35674x]
MTSRDDVGGLERGGIHAKASRANIVYILIAGMGSFVFGYANNCIAGTLAQPSFQVLFLSGSNEESIIGGIMGAFLGGGAVGAIVQGPISNHYGRRGATGFAAILMVIAGALQAGSVHIAMFLVARLLCGISAGMVITNCPVYMSEIAPPHIRGMMVSNHAISIVYAYIFSSLMALAFSFVDAPYQWRLNYVLLTFFALVLLVSLFFLPESPRWLYEKGRDKESWEVIQKLHKNEEDPDGEFAKAEMSQIQAQIEIERALPRGYLHILQTPHLRFRAALSVLVWFMGQSTGILVIANLTPTLFADLGFDTTLQFGLSAAWTVCALLGTFVNAAFMDRIGRVKLLAFGGYIAAGMLICEAVLEKYYIGSPNKTGLNAAVAFYFLFIFFYGCTVDCAAYVYITEIWPTHLRSYGATIGLVSFFVFAIAYTCPASQAFAQIGWKYYWVMICTCILSATVVYFVCPETAKLTLEEINALFGDEVAQALDQVGNSSAFESVKENQDNQASHIQNKEESFK